MSFSKSAPILETSRLALREFKTSDSDFIIELVNSPKWLEFIGDKKVKSTKDALGYLENGPLKSYSDNGFGLWLVELKDSKISIGMCGLIKRETLQNIDFGFAFLPEFYNNGYAYEIASATLDYAKNQLNLKDIIAITDPKNKASIKLLDKIGLSFEKSMLSENKENLLLLSSRKNSNDHREIDKLITKFYALFDTNGGRIPNLEIIHDLFIPSTTILNNTRHSTEIYDLNSFIKPRLELLTNGDLQNFKEWEIFDKTEVHGNIAQRLSLYEKSGKRDGKEFTCRGVKSFQFIKVNLQWKISSLIWCDEESNN